MTIKVYPAAGVFILQLLFAGIGYSASLGEETVITMPMTGKAVPQLKGIDNLMVSFMKKNQVPGGSVAITRNGKLIYARGFGFADLEKQIPVEPNNLFRIASLGKMITAMGILHLADEGKLKITDKVCETLTYTPYVKHGETLDPRLNKITIEDLLHHRGGWDSNSEFKNGNIAKTLGIKYAYPKDIVRFVMGRKLDYDPGSKMVYFNPGYNILGRIIEEVSGDTYDNYIKRNVLECVGITDMQMARTEEKDLAAKEVKYYSFEHNPYTYNRFEGRYSWIVTATDMVKIAAEFDDPFHSCILSRESIDIMFRPHRFEKLKPGKSYYGCGWSVLKDSNNKLRTWHTGGMPGTNTVVVRRADGVNWVVLFNRNSNKEGKKLVRIAEPFDKVLDNVKVWPK